MSSVHDATGRLRKRRTDQRRRVWLRLLIFGLVILLALTATWLVGLSSVFRIKQVEVSGTRYTSVGEVRRVANAPVGAPLVRANVREIADRVAAIAAVREVTVSRGWPSTLQIKVTERTPAYALQSGQWLMVDRGGIIFAALPDKPFTLVESRTTSRDQAVLAGIGDVVSTMPDEIRSKVTRVEATSRDSITATLGDLKIVYGSGEQAELKNQVAAALMKSTKAKEIDVSAPGHPATR